VVKQRYKRVTAESSDQTKSKFKVNVGKNTPRKGFFLQKPKKQKSIKIKERYIEERRIGLAQYCDRCRELTSHNRLTYDQGKRATECRKCNYIRKIATIV
jgi:hypothetical protein